MNLFSNDSDSLFAGEREKTSFFSRLDWSAFWTATIVSFLVYFFTLAPTVTLEDSGELAVAGDHLGVPHPPGYPLWTMISWCFARIFSWVTFRGQPTPAWSIALGGSAVFGAIAAGLTAMLITRSGADMLRDLRRDDGEGADTADAPPSKFDSAICWCGGVASSLLFAFSPVMWSQATICEVYALNAFFLMMVMLLTYRWMRRPTPGLLWITAFVFGLGLTNYQVLLLAIVPLVIVIFLRDLNLFRDFMLVAIPMLLTLWILQLGALLPQEGFNKHGIILGACPVYSPVLFYTGLAIAGLGVIVAIAAHEIAKRDDGANGKRQHVAIMAAVVSLALGVLLMFASKFTQTKLAAANEFAAPLVDPRIYMGAAVALVGVISSCIAAGLMRRGRPWSDPVAWGPVVAIAFFAICLFTIVGGVANPSPYIPQPGSPYVPPFDRRIVILGFAAAIAVLFALACTTPSGIYYAIATAIANVALLVLLRHGALLGLNHPASWWFWTPICLNFVYLALGWMFLPYGRTVALTVLMTELGVAFYAYMPIVSDLRNPPMNWGYPRTWEGFKHAITRGQYEKLAPTDIFSSRFLKQIGSYFTDLRTQFTLLVAPLGFLPFALWRVKSGASRLRARVVAFALFVVSCVFVILAVIPSIESFFDASRLDKWLLAPVLLIAAVGGILIAESQYAELVSRTFRRRSTSEVLTLAITVLGIAGVLAIFIAKGVYSALANAAIARDAVPGAGEATLAILAAVVVVAAVLALPLAIRRFAPAARDSVEFGVDRVNQQWIIATVVAFLMMSVMLTVLANPKGDLQDAFIQKVKFISSHGLFAIWIGYGAIFSLLTIEELCRRFFAPAVTKAVRLLALVAVCVLPLIPIQQNYCNDRLVFELGGAEQNGHDYGWQFGNFQLRGAEAIIEELEPDEEPLPNPYYPPAMTTNAVFFGGTDPGRFVPTYMIYSALVRPDVFIITQNALADNTYMSVERDLYGDDMWIPTPEDSARAFQIYVDEVEAGKRPRNADLVIDHGRVQVSGALGVMEINGILCDMMFKRNKALHDFYVEESYVIQWMYPYLTPHGLILKLNSERTQITEENIRNDQDFWDWYARRLVYSKNFRRDVVAQKSFSKLRSAIAGCYVSRNKIKEAERAFSEARFLYPVSPEAIFRIAQDILLRYRRYDDAIDMIGQFLKLDPNNERAAQFFGYINKVSDVEKRIRELAASVKPGEEPPADVLLGMAECYAELENDAMAGRCLEQILTAPDKLTPEMMAKGLEYSIKSMNFPLAARFADVLLPAAGNAVSPETILDAARAYNATRQQKKMGMPLMRLLKADPEEWRAWLFLGSFYVARGDAKAAIEAFSHGLRLGGKGAETLITGDPVLQEAYMSAARSFQQQKQDSNGLIPR